MSQAYDSDDDGFGDGEGRDLPDVLPGEEDRFQVFMPAVQQLVNAIGGWEQVEVDDGQYETIYRPGDSVLGVLKDLKKLWRKDDTDDERTVARCMAKAGLMKELIALVKECTPRGDWGRKVSLMALDLVAALTWPIDVAAELKEMEDETEIPSDYASLLRYQVEYKALLLQNETLRHLLTLLIPSFANAGKDDKEDRVISLGLHVVRNLLAIKDVVAADRATGETEELSTLQSTLIVQLDKFTYLDLFLTLAAESKKVEFNPFNVLLLDMVQLIFRSVKMHDLGMDQKRAPMDKLRSLLELEERDKSRHTKANGTRHSRFGTTIAVRAPTQNLVLHSQSAITADTGKLLDEVKKTRKPPTKLVDDPSANSNLSPDAIIVLQRFSREFLDCFNEFFESIITDIYRERQKVRPADTVRALFVSRFLVEYLLLLRKKAPVDKVDSDLPLGLVDVMADMNHTNTAKWVVARIRISMDNKPVSFNELQAGIECFTQLLLLLDAMSQSSDEETKDAAEVLLNKIYYQGDVLETALAVFTLWRPEMRGQPITFLDCTIHFAYVLLRMLEKYSKSKSFMFVRKRTAQKKQKKKDNADAPIPEEYGDEEEDVAPQRDLPSYSERGFTFTAFEKRFAQEAVTKTLLVYLGRYHTLDAEQLKRVVNLIHRQVVKAHAEGLFFTIPSLHLFRCILDEKDSLPKGDGAKDLVQLISYILRQFFKQAEKDPWVIVEAALPKGRAQWQHLSKGGEDGDGMGGQRERIREQMSNAELEFIKKNNLSWSQKMGVVVSILVSDGHEAWIKETISVLEIVLAARQEVVLRIDGEKIDEEGDEETVVRNFGGPSKDAIDAFIEYTFLASDKDLESALTFNQHVKLMFTLLHFEKDDADETLLRWRLPASVVPSVLETSIGALNRFLLDPPTVEDPKKLLRRAGKKRERAPKDADDDDEPRVRRARKVAEVQTFKSAAFIYDSDDDEDADAAFFAREQQLRAEMQALAELNGNTMRATGTKKRKRKGAKDKGNGEAEGDDGEGDIALGAVDSENERPVTRRRSIAVLDDDDSDAASVASEDEDAFGATFDAAFDAPSEPVSPAVSQAASQMDDTRVDPDEGAEDKADEEATPPRRRTLRIVDSDDDE